jgi:hypothetical protein
MFRRTWIFLAVFSLGLSPLSAAAEGPPVPGLEPVSESSKPEIAGVTGGSYFRMFDPGGGLVTNGSSSCGDKTFTPLTPGTDGGLSTSGYQPHPNPAFDSSGNGTNSKITQPEAFYGTRFSTATNSRDPQTNSSVGAPRILHDGSGKLSGDLRAFAAAWQNQHFNQGAPKPDGSSPGQTAAVSGTFSSDNGSFTIEWKSHIVGGPFNNFTGLWHFEGTFESGQVAASQKADPGQQVSVKAAGSSRTLSSTGPPFKATLGGALLLSAIFLFVTDRLLSLRERTGR